MLPDWLLLGPAIWILLNLAVVGGAFWRLWRDERTAVDDAPEGCPVYDLEAARARRLP